jgi:hypothetical protein
MTAHSPDMLRHDAIRHLHVVVRLMHSECLLPKMPAATVTDKVQEGVVAGGYILGALVVGTKLFHKRAFVHPRLVVDNSSSV